MRIQVSKLTDNLRAMGDMARKKDSAHEQQMSAAAEHLEQLQEACERMQQELDQS